MQAIDSNRSHPCWRVALLAGAAFVAALAFAAPSEAFAACGGGTGGSTGIHVPSAGAGGTFSGSRPSAGSGGGSSCGVGATRGAVFGAVTPSLAGVHTGVITGNGGKRNRSTTFGRTPSTVTTSRTASTATNIAHTASGAPMRGRVFHAGKHP